MLAFSTATISDASAAAVGQAMAERFRDDIVAHAAWSLVEEFTATSGTVRWYVFQCDDASSGLSKDFHVVLGRTLSTGELKFALCEDYNSTTHTMSRFVPVIAGNYAYDSVGANPLTYVLGTSPFSGSSNTPLYNTWTPGGTSAKFWLIVDDDAITAAWSGLTEGFIRYGAYIPLTDLTNNCPIMMMGHSTAGGITRNPAVASQTLNSAAMLINGGGTTSFDGVALGFRGDIRYLDQLHSDQSLVSEVGIVLYQYTANAPEIYGYALGKQKGMRYGGGSPPVGFVWGDSYVLDGELWIPYKANDLRIYNTGVAA